MKRVFLIFLISINCYSQNITYFSDNIDKIENELYYLLENKDYILFGTIHKMNLIVKEENEFSHYVFVNLKEDMKLLDLTSIKNNCLELVFDKTNYIKGIIDSNSNFYKENPIEMIIGDPFYFSYNQSYKNRYCEYFLTTGMKPNPIKQEVNTYLGSIMIGYSYNCEY
ncbi:hypothetical protein MG290_04890 [Flavobacterium sp. CBA20B-1]|uniref:hypothetical protein n=1 Tax=unclassified Flavobacterium TaxID=196869 RepID=UPI002224B5F3|nr:MULTISPECIES: hypothetical protein [unclassified Flavobacterium]WCM43011.1 hypothetical protein MG290_04890 [Flavobacterium sp. CBA20B-1]